MEDFISYLNNKTNNKYAYLKLNKATFFKAENKLFLVLLYPDEKGNIDDTERGDILKHLKEYVNLDINFELKFVKSFYDKEHIKYKINAFNQKEYPALESIIITDNLTLVQNDKEVEITIECYKGYMSKEQLKKYKQILENYFNKESFYYFTVEIKEINKTLNKSIINQKKKDIMEQISSETPKQTKLKVEVIEQVIGDDTSLEPLCVSSIISEEKGVFVAGTIKYLSEREFTKKQRVMDAEQEVYNEITRTYYSFSLESAGKELNAVYFPNSQTLEKMKTLNNGDDVVIMGDVEKFNSRLSLKVKHITKVKILNKPTDNITYKPVPKTYKFVTPEPFEVVTQASLFDNFDEPTDYLKNNTFVVFDLETTGLNHEDCQIVEIGAVKIENGKITTKFSTFVDPEVEIPLDATAIHGITDAMVMGAPKVHEALADFYKYCEGSTLIAYNIDFDYKFINYYGRKNGYLFDNNQLDALVVAKKYIKGLRNYKLKTVAEALGVNLTNAHRAYFDAAATAEVFLKLAKNIK